MFIGYAFFKGTIKSGMEEAFAFPTRSQSKETSKKLFEMFERSVIHTVFPADQFDPFAAG